MRELGYPVWDKPEDDDIKEFILHHRDATYQEMLRRISCAWENMHIKENGGKRKNMATRESFTLWFKEKVWLVKMPFVVDPTYFSDIPDPILVFVEEVDCLKAIVPQLEWENESLEYDLYNSTYEKNQLSFNLRKRE